MTDQTKAENFSCRYCGKKHDTRSTMDERRITQRDNRAPRGLRHDQLWFCKEGGCGGYYQMGCEG